MVNGPSCGMRINVRSKRVRGKHADKDVEERLNAGMRRADNASDTVISLSRDF